MLKFEILFSGIPSREGTRISSETKAAICILAIENDNKLQSEKRLIS